MGINPYWKELSQTKLTDLEVQLFAEQLDWKVISKNGRISHKMWVENEDFLDFNTIVHNPHIEARTYNAFDMKLDWQPIEEERNITDEFLLEVSDKFYTANFAARNRCAKSIKNETWEKIMERNAMIMSHLIEGDRKYHIKTQLVSLDTLSAYSAEWGVEEWNAIAKLQRLDVTFIKENWTNINIRYVKEKNKIHILTDEDFDEIAAYISKDFLDKHK